MTFCRRTLPGLAPLLALAAFSAPTARAGEDLHVGAATVEDTRGTDGMGGLSIELKVTGAAAAEVKALRVKLKSARDDLGTVLYVPDPDRKPAFEEFSVDVRPKPKIALKSPARGAARVDVVGEADLFVPSRDPATRQRIEGALGRLDKPIASAALKSAKVVITPLSPAEYKAREAKSRPSKDEIVAEGKKHGASDQEIEQALKLMEAMASLGGEPDEKSLLFEVSDPEGKLLGLELLDKEGKPVSAQMRSSSGGPEHRTMTMNYGEKPPVDAALLVTLRTSKSLVTVPLEMKGVALP